jgi:endonuclease YncB( thermonuclease family)
LQSLALLSSPAVAGTWLTRPAQVVDGDSLNVSGVSVRLFGIDALEGRQNCARGDQPWACGEEAARQLRMLIGANPVRCEGLGYDTHGRCHPDPVELNRAMVARGWALALALRKYSILYVTDEEQAKSSRLGIWSSTFVSPEEYRSAPSRQNCKEWPRPAPFGFKSRQTGRSQAASSREIATARASGSTTCQACLTTT